MRGSHALESLPSDERLRPAAPQRTCRHGAVPHLRGQRLLTAQAVRGPPSAWLVGQGRHKPSAWLVRQGRPCGLAARSGELHSPQHNRWPREAPVPTSCSALSPLTAPASNHRNMLPCKTPPGQLLCRQTGIIWEQPPQRLGDILRRAEDEVRFHLQDQAAWHLWAKAAATSHNQD